MIFPAASTIVRQCSHLASTPNSPFPSIQFFGPSSGSWPVPPDPGRAETVASRHGKRPIGKIRLGPKFTNQLGSRPLDVGKLAAEEQENAIRIFRVDALPRSPGPLLISGQGADVLAANP